MIRSLLRICLVASALLVFRPAAAQEAAPPQPTATEAEYAAVVQRAVGQYIVPAYRALEEETGQLSQELAEFCDGRSDREAVRAAFAAVLRAWAKVDFLRFGPMAQEGRYERFSFWPDVHGTGARQIRQFLANRDAKLLQPGALARQSAAVQGLPALESVLFSGDKALLGAKEPDAFRCGLAMAIGSNMQTIAAHAVAGWTGPDSWAALVREPAPLNPVYRSHAEAMTEILRGILTGLEQNRDHRLLPALGATPDEGKASAPFYRSGQALPYLQASAEGLEAFAETSGILELAPEAQAWIASSIRFEFANLLNALQAAGPDLEAALKQPERRARLVYATIVLASLRDLFQEQLSPAAGLTAGFNSLDGD